MKLTELFEGREALLYHWLDNNKAEWLVEHDELLGKWDHYMPVEGKSFQGNSLSRNKGFDLQHSSVRLTFNQAKLAARFKIIPVDGSYLFHGRKAHIKGEKPNLDHLRDRTFLSSESNYAEEFVVGDIKSAHSYITEMSVRVKSGIGGRISAKLETALQDYCTKHSIKLVMLTK
jgi:hypothetical protein